MIGKTNMKLVKALKFINHSLGSGSSITPDSNGKWHSVCTLGGRTTYEGVSGSYNGNILTYEEAVDLTDVEAIECSFSLNSYTNRTNTQIFVASLPIVSTREAVQPNKVSSLDFNTGNSIYPITMSLNVSDLSGEYYIGFTMFSYDTSSSKHDGYIYDIKLIKNTENRYGDGGKNIVTKGYNNCIAVNGNTNLYQTTSGYGNYVHLSNQSGSTTTFNQIGLWSFFEAELYASYGRTTSWITAVQNASPIKNKVAVLNQFDGVAYTSGSDVSKRGLVSSGINTKTFEQPVTGNKTFGTVFAWGNLSGSRTISGLKFMHNGTYYTLEELADNQIIKPLVLMASNKSTNIFNVYTAGSVSGSYSHFIAMFMTNDNANITGCQFTSSASFSGGDGWMAGMTDIKNFDITYVDDEETPL